MLAIVGRREHAGHSPQDPGREPGGRVLDFVRGEALRCIANLSADSISLPDEVELVLSSIVLDDPREVPSDAAVWLRVPSIR